MTQLSLFEHGPQILLDDATGTISLIPDVLGTMVAERCFVRLLEDIAWLAGRRMMYEREVDVPRLRAHFSADDPAMPPVLQEALKLVQGQTATAFNSIGLNLYRDEHDSVAPHNDKLVDLVRGQPIALISLGATRRMSIRSKKPPRRVLHVDLVAGSLLLMSWKTQLHFDHGIPKQSDPSGPRISLAFRVRQ